MTASLPDVLKEGIYTTRCRIAPRQTGIKPCCTTIKPTSVNDLKPDANVLNNLFGKRKDYEFVALVQVTLEDQTIRQNSLTLLALPQSQRLSQLQRLEIGLAEEHTTQPLISAICFLKDADIASRTRYILDNIE